MTQTNAKTELTLEIDSLSYGPYGVGRLEGKAVMIPNTAPGDKVSARIVESKERYVIGELVQLLRPGPTRRVPPCPYVGKCGGCPWQHVRYDAQLTAKQQSVEDALQRIGKLQSFELRSIIPPADEYRYRRRIRLQLDNDRRLGFYRTSSHRLVEIEACLIAVDAVSDSIARLRTWVREIRSPLEYVEVVAGDRPGELVVVAKSNGDFFPGDESVCRGLLEKEPRIVGLVVADRGERRTWGETRISVMTEDGIRLSAEADVFTQVNPDGNRRILTELLTEGGFENQDRVLELYCGPGNFTLSMAKRAREVVAVEGYRPSITSGKLSAQLNGIDNIRWIVSHVPAAVERLAGRREKFSKVVLDPPRAGAKGIERSLASFSAEKILYISCNPTTLARDLAAIAKHGYKLICVQPIDLFPQTFHVENLAVLERE
jgi:23S rRNA (uracil1939-C5)-methyltransferase